MSYNLYLKNCVLIEIFDWLYEYKLFLYICKVVFLLYVIDTLK